MWAKDLCHRLFGWILTVFLSNSRFLILTYVLVLLIAFRPGAYSGACFSFYYGLFVVLIHVTMSPQCLSMTADVGFIKSF